MRLDEIDGVRRKSCLGVGALQCALLAGRKRRGQPERLAIARSCDGLDHRIDAVAVALGVGKSLQYDRRETFGDDNAVALCIKCARLAGRRERRSLGEAHVGERALHRINAAGDGEIGTSGCEFVDGDHHRSQR